MANGDQATAPGVKDAPKATTASVQTSPQTAGAPAVDSPKEAPAAVEAVPTVKLRSKNVEQYPLTVSVVGSDDLVFENASATVEVPSEVAEQIAYSPVVEVAE